MFVGKTLVALGGFAFSKDSTSARWHHLTPVSSRESKSESECTFEDGIVWPQFGSLRPQPLALQANVANVFRVACVGGQVIIIPAAASAEALIAPRVDVALGGYGADVLTALRVLLVLHSRHHRHPSPSSTASPSLFHFQHAHFAREYKFFFGDADDVLGDGGDEDLDDSRTMSSIAARHLISVWGRKSLSEDSFCLIFPVIGGVFHLQQQHRDIATIAATSSDLMFNA